MKQWNRSENSKQGVHECKHQTNNDDECSASKNVEEPMPSLKRQVGDTRHVHKSPAQQERKNASLAVCFEMKDMEVEHVVATNCVLAWAKSCWNEKNAEGMHRVWTFTMTKKISWEEGRCPSSSVNLQLQYSGVKWPR